MNFLKKLPSGVYALIGSLLIVLIVFSLVPAIANAGINKVVGNYEKLVKGKVTDKRIESLIPDDLWDELDGDMDKDDVIEAISDCCEEDAMDDDDKLDISVVKTVSMTKDELEEARDSFEEEYGIDGDEVTAGKHVLVQFDAKYKDEKAVYCNWAEFYKYDGKWYCPEVTEDLIDAIDD